MVISGLGSSQTPFPTVTPHLPAVALERAQRPDPEETDFDHLSDGDRELIRQTTGERILPGYDPAHEKPSRFAAAIAADRTAGLLAPGQEVTTYYLKDLSHRYDRGTAPNPIAPYMDRAVSYLSTHGGARIDVTA